MTAPRRFSKAEARALWYWLWMAFMVGAIIAAILVGAFG